MKNLLFLLLISTIFSCTQKNKTFQNSEISVIPEPTNLILEDESFLFTSTTQISIEEDNQLMAATYLNDLFKQAAGFNFTVKKSNSAASITFKKVENLAPEAYILKISSSKIVISANDAAGYFYGIQTLRQLLPAEIESKQPMDVEWLVPCVTIQDSPRFSWRGMHMDFSRHFFSLENVKTFLDYMAMYKMNTYHMHLTDDQGWRIEIKKYPLLTQKGAWRIESSHDKECKELAKTNPSFTIDEQHYHEINGQKMYGGFFTQNQIKEIISYASDRNIEVIPEIDMPGHFKAAIDNYPYLSCTGKAGWGNHFSIPACLGKETSYQFAKDILSEVAALFPSKYIHIGGDEVNIDSWKKCPNCQRAIQKNKLKNEHELQSFFNKDIEQFLHSKGKKLIGWDEIVDGGLSSDATVMWWRNWAPKARYIAANNGSNMIICPDFEYYFDFTNEATPIDKVYNYEPVPEDFTKEQEAHVLGVQANLWSERIPNFKRLQYQTFPRILALSETAWSSKSNKNYDDFQQKLLNHYQRLDFLDIQYYIPTVEGLADKIAFLDEAKITLTTPLSGMDIYYTLDGTQPTKNSLKYTAPLTISKNTTIKTIAYRGNNASEVKTAVIEKQTYKEPLKIEPKIGSIQQWVALNKFNVVEEVKLPTQPIWKTTQKIDLTGYETKDHVSMVFKGYFKAEEDGLYQFSTKSDDGSLLYLHNKLVVNNGGNHAAILKDGMIALKKGWHPISIYFHEASGGNELTVWYKSPTQAQKKLEGSVIAY